MRAALRPPPPLTAPAEFSLSICIPFLSPFRYHAAEGDDYVNWGGGFGPEPGALSAHGGGVPSAPAVMSSGAGGGMSGGSDRGAAGPREYAD